MNFLAHLFLSCERDELVVGNFLADFISNKEVGDYSEGIREGIFLHRKIDSFTDRHPLVLQGVRRLYPAHSKYAPVIIDVFYDYLLANNWETYSRVGQDEFARKIYLILEAHLKVMPKPLQDRLKLMIEEEWLRVYNSFEGMEYTFGRMKKRVSRPALLDNSVESLRRDLKLLNEEFNDFFPQVMDFVKCS